MVSPANGNNQKSWENKSDLKKDKKNSLNKLDEKIKIKDILKPEEYQKYKKLKNETSENRKGIQLFQEIENEHAKNFANWSKQISDDSDHIQVQSTPEHITHKQIKKTLKSIEKSTENFKKRNLIPSSKHESLKEERTSFEVMSSTPLQQTLSEQLTSLRKSEKKLLKLSNDQPRLESVQSQIKKIEEYQKKYIDLENEVHQFLTKPTVSSLRPYDMNNKIKAFEEQIKNKASYITSTVSLFNQVDNYAKEFETKYLPEIKQRAEDYKKNGMRDSDFKLSYDFISEWRSSGKSIQDFMKDKLSGEVLIAYEKIKELQKNAEDSLKDKVDEANKKYNKFLEKIHDSQVKAVDTINTVAGNTATAKSVAKGMEYLYIIGSFIHKPSEEVDNDIKAIIEFNNNKNQFFDHLGEFIMDPKQKIKKMMGIENK